MGVGALLAKGLLVFWRMWWLITPRQGVQYPDIWCWDCEGRLWSIGKFEVSYCIMVFEVTVFNQ